MTPPTETFTIGVEEEYQIIDPVTRQLRPRQGKVLPAAQQTLGEGAQPELHTTQIEVATPICRTLTDVRAALVRSRQAVREAAARDGDRIVAAATHPLSRSSEHTIAPKERYQQMLEDYQKLARELIIFGCHVHVSLQDRELAIQVLNRARPWLATLLALSANSPFWAGEDTGYASFRTEMWVRWPMAGPPLPFASLAEHDALVQSLVATGSISDATKIYWDIRLPQHIPTVEVRVADVCATVDESTLLVGLIRALVQTCYAQTREDTPVSHVRPELLRAAHWRAARYGLEGELIDVTAGRSVPAIELVHALRDWVRPALETSGDWDEVSALLAETLGRGNGAQRQREVYERTGRLEDVVDFLIAETARGVE